MTARRHRHRTRRTLLAVLAVAAMGACALVGIGVAQAATSLPCDIYAAAGTPCVAAHSTTRALVAGYSGKLYRVKRWSDGSGMDIGTLTAGGYANAAAQDSFCGGASCTITEIYDQTPRHNNLPNRAATAPDRWLLRTIATSGALPLALTWAAHAQSTAVAADSCRCGHVPTSTGRSMINPRSSAICRSQ